MSGSPALAEVLADHLDHFRESAIAKVRSLGEGLVEAPAVASGWTPHALLGHLAHMERRWVVWGFLGEDIADPWGDHDASGERWVTGTRTLDGTVAMLRAGGVRTRQVLLGHDLAEVAPAGPRFASEPPASLQRIGVHLLQEYARHLGHLDVVAEQAGGLTGE